MPFIPAPNIAQAEITCLLDGQRIQNVLHFRPNATLDPPLMAELAAHLVSWWNTGIKINVPSTQSLIEVKIVDLTTDVAPVLNYTTGLPIAGTNPSPALPNNCALVFTKRSNARGRSNRGRIYHAALLESQVTGNTVAPSTVSGLQTVYSQLIDFDTANANWEMYIISRYTGGAPRTVAEEIAVLNITSDGVVDSQRRRLPGRGA